MHIASVMADGAGGVRVLLSSTAPAGRFVTAEDESTTEEADEGPSPITPEGKELFWSLGAFLVLLVAMRLWLVPKLKEGMQRRYGKVRSDLEHAEEMRDAARQEVAQYEAQLAAVRSEATARIDAARDVLDRERTDRLNEANAAIAGRRSAAAAEAETARAAAASSVEDAAAAVAAATRRAEHRPTSRRGGRAPRRRRPDEHGGTDMTHVATLLAAEEHIDRTHSWIWPEGYELVFGSIASIIIFTLLFWKVGPLAKKAMAARTARIQDEIDGAAAALQGAEADSVAIRQALGDISAERSRILAEADERAEAMVTDGRARLDAEIVDLHAKADADIAAAMSRGGDELRAEVAHLAAGAAEGVVQITLDDQTQQRLVEDFISRVGAGATT